VRGEEHDAGQEPPGQDDAVHLRGDAGDRDARGVGLPVPGDEATGPDDVLVGGDGALAEQARTVEASIRVAISVLEERAALLRTQGQGASGQKRPQLARRLEGYTRDAEGHAEAIRTSMLGLVRSLGATAAEGEDADEPGPARATPAPERCLSNR
jgi:hypothetical protein